MSTHSQEALSKTPLHALHLELGAKMVPFAGFEMPVQYPTGVLAEHKQTRAAAGLFDVSHMGQVRLLGDHPAAALERLVPGDIAELAPGELRYTMFTDEQGGILDDLMVTRHADAVFVVVNAACKEADLAHLEAGLGGACEIDHQEGRGLLALQGPAAAAALARHAPAAAGLDFMSAASMDVAGIPCEVSRSGYTGEDGFEISVAGAEAEALARLLLAEPEVAPIGLGARDSLRLEAGLCLYGHDIDRTTTPVEAALSWTIGRRRRREANFPGAATILDQIANGAPRKRIGIRPDGRAPARAGTEITLDGATALGRVTSGGFGPTIGGPCAMGYVPAVHAAPATALHLLVRGKPMPARVVKLPFAPHRYHKS